MIRINEMNKIIICVLFLSLFLFSGCIPYGYETESQKIIGKRSDANGKICEQIVRYNKKLKFIGIIGHDGFFFSRLFLLFALFGTYRRIRIHNMGVGAFSAVAMVTHRRGSPYSQ